MKILLATNNGAKIERLKKLLRFIDFNMEVFSPSDLGIEIIEVEESGATLTENAEIKARAYLGNVTMPILANDTGFYVEGEGFVEAPKRIALGGASEKDLSKDEISKKILDFWKDVARKHGGAVDAAWIEAFVVVYPDGSTESICSRREIILTDQEFGIPHQQFPVRALYRAKATNKPAICHTDEEEILEMKPVIGALMKVLRICA